MSRKPEDIKILRKEILKLWSMGASSGLIGTLLGRDHSTILHHFKVLGLQSNGIVPKEPQTITCPECKETKQVRVIGKKFCSPRCYQKSYQRNLYLWRIEYLSKKKPVFNKTPKPLNKYEKIIFSEGEDTSKPSYQDYLNEEKYKHGTKH